MFHQFHSAAELVFQKDFCTFLKLCIVFENHYKKSHFKIFFKLKMIPKDLRKIQLVHENTNETFLVIFKHC